MTTSSKTPRAQRVAGLVLRGLSIAWAAFWVWFVLMVSYGGAEMAPPWWIPVAWLAALALLVALAWKRPAAGGVALAVAGLACVAILDHPGARALLAAPALLLGLGFLALRWRERRGLAVLILGLWIAGCRAAQDPADLPYRTSSILRHENGRLQRAWLTAPAELAGLPCRGWVWWHPDGRLDNAELAADGAVQGHAFPKGTRVFFDPEGRLAHAWLSQDAHIDGLLCRGRWKIDTAFHPNGRIQAFFPPAEIELDGVRCVASVFHPVYLHPDGHLRQCKLARSVELEGRTYEKGEVLALDEAGRAVR